MVDLPGDWDTVPEHPGEQCHDAHPGRPHSRPRPTVRETPPSPPPNPPGFPIPQSSERPELEQGPLDGAQVDRATALILLGSDPWNRFDTWAARAWDLAEKSIAAAAAEGARNTAELHSDAPRYDPRAQNMLDVARMCADLAQAVCPLAALGGLPPKLPELELEIPI